VVNLRESRIMDAPADLPARRLRLSTLLATWRPVLLSIASLIVAFCIWQFLSTVLFNPFLIPPPLKVFRTAIPMLASGEILTDVAISMSRVMVGFVTGSLAGIVMGVLLGRIRLLHDLLDPIIELLRYLSPTAMIPIAVIWFGIGHLQIFTLVVVPSTVPYIVTGMRVAMASSFMSIIPAEILAADSGIGYLLQKSSMLLQTDRIFVALLTICVLGFVVDRIFRLLVDRVLARYMSVVSQT
jgi:ABC-type nitrate/sulfonate/bicarbonate transport system permease component